MLLVVNVLRHLQLKLRCERFKAFATEVAMTGANKFANTVTTAKVTFPTEFLTNKRLEFQSTPFKIQKVPKKRGNTEGVQKLVV